MAHTISRLSDKAVQVRKNAIQLLAVQLQYNPYGPSLRLSQWRKKLEELKQKLPEEVRNKNKSKSTPKEKPSKKKKEKVKQKGSDEDEEEEDEEEEEEESEEEEEEEEKDEQKNAEGTEIEDLAVYFG